MKKGEAEKKKKKTGGNAAYLAFNGRQNRRRNPVLLSSDQFEILVFRF